MSLARKYEHLITFDEMRKVLVIFRVFADGTRHLYTEISLFDDLGKGDNSEFNRCATRLGESIIVDSIEARRAFGI